MEQFDSSEEASSRVLEQQQRNDEQQCPSCAAELTETSVWTTAANETDCIRWSDQQGSLAVEKRSPGNMVKISTNVIIAGVSSTQRHSASKRQVYYTSSTGELLRTCRKWRGVTNDAVGLGNVLWISAVTLTYIRTCNTRHPRFINLQIHAAVLTSCCRSGLARYISPIYIIDIHQIYIRYFHSKISDIFDIFNFYEVLKNIINVKHCDYVLIFSLCVLLAYDLCPQHFLSVGQLVRFHLSTAMKCEWQEYFT